jgi:hypothetical protein
VKRLTLTLILLMGLFACTPSVTPTIERDGDTVTARISVEEPLYLASLILAHENGAPLTGENVSDPRCTEGRVEGLALYMACDLGTIQPRQEVTVVAKTALPLTCMAGGYTDTSATSYRTVPCRVAD